MKPPGDVGRGVVDHPYDGIWYGRDIGHCLHGYCPPDGNPGCGLPESAHLASKSQLKRLEAQGAEEGPEHDLCESCGHSRHQHRENGCLRCHINETSPPCSGFTTPTPAGEEVSTIQCSSPCSECGLRVPCPCDCHNRQPPAPPEADGGKRGQPLGVKVADGVLTASIGIDTLAFAFEMQAGKFDDDQNAHVYPYRVEDEEQFAKDVSAAMQDEREDGSSPLTDFLDRVAQDAVDQGSLGLAEEGYGANEPNPRVDISPSPADEAEGLRPCPFCGSAAWILPAPHGYFRAACSGCCVNTGAARTEAEAIAAWNRRRA